MLDGMSEGFALLDSEFRIIDVNREAMRMTKRPRDEVIGLSLWSVFPQSETTELGRLYYQAMNDRMPVALEHRYIWPDGQSSWLATRVSPTDDGGLAVFYRDITERRENERKLRESEARFRAAIKATHGVMWTNDAVGRMIGPQPGWSALTGQSEAEYKDYGWAKALHPDDAQSTIDAWEDAVADILPFKFEHRLRRADGESRRYAIRAIPVLDDAGVLQEWVGVHIDITDARAGETRFRQLAENIAEVFYVMEVDEGRISYVSPAYEQIWRQPTKALYEDATAYTRAVHPDDMGQIEKALTRQRAGRNSDIRYRLLFEDGTVTYIHDRAFVTFDPDTDARRVVGIAENVTASAQAQLRQDVLMREIEHRVRNSLSIVGGLLSMQERTAPNPETAAALRAAAARVVAIARIHERLYKAKNLEVIEFEAYLTALCEDLATTATHDGLSFEVQTSPVEIPVEQAVPLGLIANELITNACKYSGTEQPVTVTVELTAGDEDVTLAVSNTGNTVPATFDPKARAGLGMQVIGALVGQLRGEIAMPEPGGEARFVVTVPLVASN